MPRTLVSLVNILEIHLLPQVAHGYGSTDECRKAQKTFCNYVAAANETELEVIKDVNSQYQVKTSPTFSQLASQSESITFEIN